jgi:hypothetical protein
LSTSKTTIKTNESSAIENKLMAIDLVGHTMSASGVDIDSKQWTSGGNLIPKKVVNDSINRIKPTTECGSSKWLCPGLRRPS